MEAAVKAVEPPQVPAGQALRVKAEQKKPAVQGKIFTTRMRILLESATIMAPLTSMATLAGLLNEAPGAPSAKAPPLEQPLGSHAPFPASVVTTPFGATFRMRWFSASATITLSLASMATPRGVLNRALEPVASTHAP